MAGWLDGWRAGGLDGWMTGGLDGWRAGGLEGGCLEGWMAHLAMENSNFYQVMLVQPIYHNFWIVNQHLPGPT